MARVQVIQEAREHDNKEKHVLCFQWCLYIYDDGTSENGYRFIWRRPESWNMLASRGQARLPSIKRINALMEKAKLEGWGSNDGDL